MDNDTERTEAHRQLVADFEAEVATPVHVDDEPTRPEAPLPMRVLVAEREAALRYAERYPVSGLGEDDRGKW